MTGTRHLITCVGISIFLIAAGLSRSVLAQEAYFPGAGDDWERRAPSDVGMNADSLQAAISFAKEHEAAAPRDLEEAHYFTFGREPFGDAVGPFKPRGNVTGIVVRHGYIVEEWGEPERIDMTFSVTKSFLSTVVGLARDRGLVRDLHDAVHDYMAPVVPAPPTQADTGMDAVPDVLELFETPHNRIVTWDHLLRQTSDWEGMLWAKPDWADRPQGDPASWRTRERHEPGSVYTYNDVRVNLLALAAMNVWREPLPRVLRREIMEPIGASPRWRWYGYENSWIVIDGLRMQAVSGGGHWGGGMFISARDQARFGYLTLHRGRWNGRQLLSDDWFDLALTPTDVEPGYGFMNFFLNTGRERFPDAPESAYAHLGAGVNMIYVDPEHDLVVVARWIDGEAMAELVGLVLASIEE